MANEGLCYFVVRRSRGLFTIPDNPTPKQIMDDFLSFSLRGVRDQQGDPIDADDDTGKMTGVINWLSGLNKFTANFFTAMQPGLMVFVSLADGTDDWTKLPGFMLFVMSGILTINLQNGQFKSEGEFILQPRIELDKALADMKPKLDKVSAQRKRGIQAALRGDKGTNLRSALDDLEAAEKIGLRDLINNR